MLDYLVRMNPSQLALHFFFQVAVILLACQLVGLVCRKFGQPQVVAEMLTGVILGPSLFGLFFPEVSARIFPADSMALLFTISQFGLAAYMFVVGMEFRIDIVQQRMRSALAVSVVGMVVPFVMGAGLAVYFFSHTDFFPKPTNLFNAAIFLGASMCITAFPMLARIIQHKNLEHTAMGSVSLGAGAINDGAAWCLLAVVLASIDGNMSHALMNIGGGLLYVSFTLVILRPLLNRYAKVIEARGTMLDSEFVGCLILFALGSWITDLLGLHAVLGAFIMGMVMPRGIITQKLTERIEPFTMALLLPLFFTYSGLNTKLGLLDSGYLWFMAILVLVVAISGKGVACWIAARATGVPNREALGIGILMNTRGLMELIIITIGLQKGIISPALFAVLVVMAVVTTLMTSPTFEWFVGRFQPKKNDSPTPSDSFPTNNTDLSKSIPIP